MPGPEIVTNAAGRRVIQLYLMGIATREQLDTAYYEKGWISDADYQTAIAEPEPAPTA